MVHHYIRKSSFVAGRGSNQVHLHLTIPEQAVSSVLNQTHGQRSFQVRFLPYAHLSFSITFLSLNISLRAQKQGH
jgi:hypothetical protein